MIRQEISQVSSRFLSKWKHVWPDKISIITYSNPYYTFTQISQYYAKYAFYTNFVDYCDIFAYYAVIMLNTIATLLGILKLMLAY